MHVVPKQDGDTGFSPCGPGLPMVFEHLQRRAAAIKRINDL